MFLNHDAAFDTFAPVTDMLPQRHSITATATTMFEVEQGWKPLQEIKAGDALATLEGGFARILSKSDAAPRAMIHVPGGALSTCSDVLLPADAHVALDIPAHIADTPIVSVPLSALCGWNGICRELSDEAAQTLTFADEEMVFAQTGLLLHAHQGKPGFYERKTYGEARALLTLVAGRLPAPDQAIAA